MSRALFSQDGQTWHDQSPVDWRADPTVTKIVIGQPPKKEGEAQPVKLKQKLPADLASLYPNLTHLHLWQIADLKSLPYLPPGLKCLDVRGCAQLLTMPSCPADLDTLVLEGCESLGLDSDSNQGALTQLRDLSLRGCVSVSQSWIQSVLGRSRQLQKLDLSHCIQLDRISVWPPSLIDIRLDGCRTLKGIPAWPPELRRINLRNAASLRKLADFPATIDYVDLAWTKALNRLPSVRQRPRTLCLYGSGILEPPASEHGSHDTENVALDVQSYFDDLQLTGQGTINRCKLLILGNGEAGKTCLSLHLTGRDPALAEALGSTHGVQFWDWNFDANVDGVFESVHLHLWDFGGQEIYHNTHRLFMSKGTVFVVVWKPDQDDGRSAPATAGQYADERRPLQYWLDFIRLTCDHNPRIAIVCSWNGKQTDELERKWREQVRAEFHERCRCFYIDSLEQRGETSELIEWLQDEVGELIQTHGTAVPSYWEIAQELVEEWVGKIASDPAFAAEHNSLTADEFQHHLATRIERTLAQDAVGKYDRLRQAMTDGTFELTSDRVRRTLNFLTRSGWVYWDADLFEGRVIVGQQWALDGLYAILDRRKEREIFKRLNNSDGRFTASDLAAWAWNGAGYSAGEQKLLLSFMEKCGLCFQLRKAESAWRDEDVFISFEHLPTAKELRLQRDFDDHPPGHTLCEDKIEVPFLHKFDWHGFLADCGRKYGTDASYASDALLLRTEHDQLILITCSIDRKSGLGGAVEVQAAGNATAELVSEILKELRGRFPVEQQPGRKRSMAPAAMGTAKPRREVFVSYSWNSAANPHVDYVAPVEAIERFLRSQNFEIKRSHPEETDSIEAPGFNPGSNDVPLLVRDSSTLKEGDDIAQFMRNGAKKPHVILVHSDRYWKSPDCMYELHELDHELLSNVGKSFAEVVIPIEHPTSNVDDQANIDQYAAYWSSYNGRNPARLGWALGELRDFAASLVRRYGMELSRLLGTNLRWKDGADKVMEGVARRLNIAPRKPGEDNNG